jgi:hypothetical protein
MFLLLIDTLLNDNVQLANVIVHVQISSIVALVRTVGQVKIISVIKLLILYTDCTAVQSIGIVFFKDSYLFYLHFSRSISTTSNSHT